MPWKRLKARNGRSALIVLSTLSTEREDDVEDDSFLPEDLAFECGISE